MDSELKVLFDQIFEGLSKHMIIGYHVTRVLTSVGIPVCVKFRFRLKDLYDFQLSKLISKMIIFIKVGKFPPLF